MQELQELNNTNNYHDGGLPRISWSPQYGNSLFRKSIPNHRHQVTDVMVKIIAECNFKFGQLEASGYRKLEVNKEHNQVQNIYAILKLNHSDTSFDDVRDAFHGNDAKYISKQKQIIRNFVNAYRYLICLKDKSEYVIDDILKLNDMLQIEATEYTAIKETNKSDLQEVFSRMVDRENVNPILKACEVFKNCYNHNLFDEFHQETVVCLFLYMLFKVQPNMGNCPLEGIITTLVAYKGADVNELIVAVLEELLEMANSILEEVSSKKQLGDTNTNIIKLLEKMKNEDELSSRGLLDLFGYKDLSTFRKRYLSPALKGGFIKYSLPNKKSSRNQTYSITEAGHNYLASQS